jgi:hypothetical protein
MLNNINNFKQFCEDAKQHKKIKKQSIAFANAIFEDFMINYEKYCECKVSVSNVIEICTQAVANVSSVTYASTIYAEGISLLLQYLAFNKMIEESDVSNIVDNINWKQVTLESSIKNTCFVSLDQCISFVKGVVNSIGNMENDALSIIALCILFWYFPQKENKPISMILKADCNDVTNTITCDGVKVKLPIKYYQFIKAFKTMEHYQGLTTSPRKNSFCMMPSEYLFRGRKKAHLTGQNLTESIMHFNNIVTKIIDDKTLNIKGIKNSSFFNMIYENEVSEGRITPLNFTERATQALKERGIKLTPTMLFYIKDGYFVWRKIYANDLKQEFANK